jgi:hypothetical protein
MPVVERVLWTTTSGRRPASGSGVSRRALRALLNHRRRRAPSSTTGRSGSTAGRRRPDRRRTRPEGGGSRAAEPPEGTLDPAAGGRTMAPPGGRRHRPRLNALPVVPGFRGSLRSHLNHRKRARPPQPSEAPVAALPELPGFRDGRCAPSSTTGRAAEPPEGTLDPAAGGRILGAAGRTTTPTPPHRPARGSGVSRLAALAPQPPEVGALRTSPGFDALVRLRSSVASLAQPGWADAPRSFLARRCPAHINHPRPGGRGFGGVGGRGRLGGRRRPW